MAFVRDGAAEIGALVRRARNGDRAAAATLLACYRPLLANLVAKARKGLLSDGHTDAIDDLWQEAYRQFLELLSAYAHDDPTVFGGYAKQMLAWRMANYLRAERRRKTFAIPLAAKHLDLAIDHMRPNLGVSPENPRLRAALRGLSPRQRTVLYGLYWQDKHVDEVATKLGLTEQAVNGLRRRAESRLRETMAEARYEGENDPSGADTP